MKRFHFNPRADWRGIAIHTMTKEQPAAG